MGGLAGRRLLSGLEEDRGLTNLASDVRVQPAENDIAVGELGHLALPHNQLARIADGRGLLPADGILILLSRGARRGADGVQLEVGVLREEEDEALAHGAGATKDTYGARRLAMFVLAPSRGNFLDCGVEEVGVRTALLRRERARHCRTWGISRWF